MKITEFLEDQGGKLSAMRIAILVWIVTICFNSIYLTIVTQKFGTPDASMVTGLGMLLGGKVVQNYTENKSVETLEKTPPTQ